MFRDIFSAIIRLILSKLPIRPPTNDDEEDCD